MLAQSAPSVDEALAATGTPAVVDVKLDGIRIQVHRSGADIAVFTRSLDEITARVPEVVAAVRALPGRELVLDGEAIGLDETGRPLPFQQTSSRAARRTTPSTTGAHTGRPGGARGGRQHRRDGAHPVLLRPAAPRRRRPDRPARPGAVGRASPARSTRRCWSVGWRSTAPSRPPPRSPPRSTPARRAWWSRRRTPPTTPAGAVPPGSRSSPGTPSTWWCSPSSGAAAGARAGCPTCISARVTRAPATSSCSARRSRGSPTSCCAGRPSGSSTSPSSAATGWSGSGPSRWWRSPSTGCRPAPAIPAGWRCGSPGWCATATTSPPRRPTPSTPSAPSTPAAYRLTGRGQAEAVGVGSAARSSGAGVVPMPAARRASRRATQP